MQNIVLLCGAHHRFVHEGGWRIEGDPAGELRFVHPDGRELRVGPPALRPEVAERFRLPYVDSPPAEGSRVGSEGSQLDASGAHGPAG